MTYQQTHKIQKYARVWAIILMLPDARHYTVARFYNRRDGEVHLASFAAVYAKV
ncbi:hypothetical protein [Microseira sp. BLCC-F43]|jgi:hypothetical protein|uniref:hypothetical protein n=1 Tax=Microseira sp. BLCC-F43 TaxID=3153602 RepID=UPI0035BA5D9D